MCHAWSMFERFNDLARQSIVLSQQEAQSLNHTQIGTEHLVLGVLQQQDPHLVPILESHGVEVEAVRDRIKQIFGGEDEPPSGHIPFSARAKKALELSYRESLELGHEYIGPIHLLLGVMREGDNGGVQVLRELNVNVEDLAREIRSQSGGEAPD